MEATLPKAIQQQLDEVTAQEQNAASQAQAVTQQTVDEQVTDQQVVIDQQVAPHEQVVHATDKPQSDVWEQKFKSLQGKFNAEVPRLYQEVREKEALIQNLNERLVKLERHEVEKSQQLVSKDDVDTFGEDMIDLVRRVVREEFSKLAPAALGAVRGEIEEIRGEVGRVNEINGRTSYELFWSKVKELVPHWDSVDTHPSWIAWLDTTPEYDDKTYREIAAKAISNGDAQRISALVKSWEKETGVATAAEKTKVNRTELARQIAPSTSKANSAPAGERYWTQAEYESAFDPRNAQRMSVQEWEALMAEADRAVAEGRIR